MHLLLFVFSVATTARPCMHGGDAHTATMSHEAMSHDMPGHDMTDMSMSHDAPLNTHSTHTPPEPSHTDGCPWVVGCAGMAQLSVDAAWRSVEHVLPSATPVGVTLREITTDRDIESPPPRA